MTLLSRPPGPTVLVGPAHCTFLCKSSKGVVDNCCCKGPNDCSDNKNRCGDDSTVVEMTGNDAEIVCGEWETGDTAPTLSGERYNIVLDIHNIVRHPNYRVNIESSAYLQNDIAIFKVNDKLLPKVSINLITLKIKLIFSRKKLKDYRCILHAFLLIKGPQDLVFTQDGLILFHSTFLKNMPLDSSKCMMNFLNKSITKWIFWKNVKMQMSWVFLVFQLNFQQTPSILLVSITLLNK